MPYANVNGTRLYYETSETGQPLILIPGLGLDHTYYAQGVPRMSQSVQTIAVDPRGVGRSAMDDTEYSIEVGRTTSPRSSSTWGTRTPMCSAPPWAARSPSPSRFATPNGCAP